VTFSLQQFRYGVQETATTDPAIITPVYYGGTSTVTTVSLHCSMCEALVPHVQKLIIAIIDEHRHRSSTSEMVSYNADFVDVLLSFDGEETLAEDDMVTVLRVNIYIYLQNKLRKEVDNVTMGEVATDANPARMSYSQAVVKETLRVHPLGPLLSWARFNESNIQLSDDMDVPSPTTTMVNIWAITHDPDVWKNLLEFKPERFVSEGGANVDMRGSDLCLAQFGVERRV
ncbi:hypothetical protein HAX54_024016, partial [Datura stramonium]|nr:hypothetical protein [Datura stramonium]